MSTPSSASPTAVRLKLLGGGLLAGAIALALTNPGKSAYVNYAAERLPKTMEQDCKTLKQDIDLADVLTLPTQDLCSSFVRSADFVGRGLVKQVVEVSTERRNWGLLSLYETQVPGRTFKTIGIAQQFWMMRSR